MRILITLLTFIGTIGISHAQFEWPADKDKAQEQYTLMSDYINGENYKAALPHWRWLYINVPDLDNNKQTLYRQGIKIFDGLTDITEDETLKMAYQDSALMMYDERINHGGDAKDVLNRKGYKVFPYIYKVESRRKELFDQYKKILEVNGTDAYYVNAKYFMKAIYLNQKTGYNFTDEQIIEHYEYVNNIVEQNIAAGGSNLAKWKDAKNDIDEDFSKMVQIDCDFIMKNWVPKFKAAPTDLAMAKKIFSGMLTGKCTDNNIWLEAGELINAKEPSYGLAKNLGIRFRTANDYDKALTFFNEAESLANTPNEKGEIAYLIAVVYYQKGSKSTARNYARKAIAEDPNGAAREAYSLIGDLYFGSYNDCKTEKEPVSRAVYIAAYNMYSKAGSTQKMSQAKEQFPSITDIFQHGMKEGEEVNIGCWINESVQLQRRPAQ